MHIPAGRTAARGLCSTPEAGGCGCGCRLGEGGGGLPCPEPRCPLDCSDQGRCRAGRYHCFAGFTGPSCATPACPPGRGGPHCTLGTSPGVPICPQASPLPPSFLIQTSTPPPAMLGPDNPHQCIPQYLLLFYNAHSVSPSQCSWLSPTECPGFLSASGFTPSPSSEFPTALGVPMALGVSTIPVSPWLGHSCSLGTPSTSLWLSPSSWCPVLWYPQGVPTPWVPHPQVSSCCSQPVVAPSWGAPEHPCGGTSQKGCVPAEIPAVTPRLTARNQTSFRVSWPRPSMPVDGYQVALIPMVSWGQGQGLGCIPSRAVSPVW